MDVSFCDVIGCTAPAERFYSDGYGPTDRLCGFHWSEMLTKSRDRALLFELVEPDRLKKTAVVKAPRGSQSSTSEDVPLTR